VVFLASENSDLITGQTFIAEASHINNKRQKPVQLLR